MGLFDRHDYGRDYGRRPGSGDRARGAWQRFEGRMHGDGRDARDEQGGYGPASFAYRGMDGGWSTGWNRGAHDVEWDWRRAAGTRYDQDLGRMERGYGADDRGTNGGYGGDYRGTNRGYDAGYAPGGADRGRGGWQRDAGDPYGDRQRRTPFHVMRGGFDAQRFGRGGGPNHPDRYDVGYRGWNRGIGNEPAYRAEDFRGWDHGRGRDARIR